MGPYKWWSFRKWSSDPLLMLFIRSSSSPWGTISSIGITHWVMMKRSSWRSVRRSRTHSLSSPPGKTPVWHRSALKSLLLSSLRVTLWFSRDDATPDHKPNIWHIFPAKRSVEMQTVNSSSAQSFLSSGLKRWTGSRISPPDWWMTLRLICVFSGKLRRSWTREKIRNNVRIVLFSSLSLSVANTSL